MAIPMPLQMGQIASAPALSQTWASVRTSTRVGVTLAMTVRSVVSLTARTTSKAARASAEKANPPPLTFGQARLTSMADTPPGTVKTSVISMNSSTVSPATFTIIGASRQRRYGSFSSTKRLDADVL